MSRKKAARKPPPAPKRSVRRATAAVPPPAASKPRLDLSRIRHDLRTPINHIIGYCEMVQEDEGTPESFQADLQKIHLGGRQLLTLITEYFDEETFESRRQDLQRLCHELRTPVNHIIGYSELLQEEAEDHGLKRLVPDLQKIIQAAHTWLGLMEEYLLPRSAPGPDASGGAQLPETGFGYSQPVARSATPGAMTGHLLVVDDDETTRDMLVRRLRRQGFEITTASNGLDALQLVRAQKFDLVLLDMVMPRLDGYQVLSRIKSDAALADIRVIMISALDQEQGIARCIEMGADDYIAKPFNPVFLRARIGACLEKKRLRDRERQTFEALQRSQQSLAAELAEAATYVRSLLPPPLEDGPIRASWKFLPSTQLGGDAFGYHWLDERHFAVFVLDVCGHGVGAALLSVSVMNVLKARSMPGVNFADPAAVLAALNQTFPMDRHNNMFFTIWYGVLSLQSRELAFASGGHPPAVLTTGDSATPQLLKSAGAIIGGFPEARYAVGTITLPAGSRLHVFSDGLYELARPDGSTVQLEEFVAELGEQKKLDDMMAWAATARNQAPFEDDVSIVELVIP
jgi:sigma-B regulation protein RsbU (phosphoserine phosphatase)